jgi:hypothetical protein
MRHCSSTIRNNSAMMTKLMAVAYWYSGGDR